MQYQNELAGQLLGLKGHDYQLSAARLPLQARVMSNMFARTLGASSGKMLLGYRAMLQELDETGNTAAAAQVAKQVVGRESKVKICVPFSQPQDARLCGLVALNHTRFFDAEALMYGNLMAQTSLDNGIEGVPTRVRRVASENRELYESLLHEKHQSIYDFGVLMGVQDDAARFTELTADMPVRLASYFRNVADMHTGRRIGVSWPLPFKKFSGAIRDGLYDDRVSYELQEGVGRDFGFVNPEINFAALAQIRAKTDEVNARTGTQEKTLLRRWQVGTALPVAAFYLTAVDAYAQTTANVPTQGDYEQAATTAATTAATSAASTADREEGLDPSRFVTTWYTWFTTLV